MYNSNPDRPNAWKTHTVEEKSHFKNMLVYNETKQSNSKKTGIGEVLELVEKENKKKQKFINNMIENIQSLVNHAKTTNSVPKLKFYVIHINYFYSYKENHANEVKYNPAEIALAEFSLEKGVTKLYTQIINENIRLGYSRAAEERSVEFHKIPTYFKHGKNNYRELFMDICNFIRPGSRNGKLPPIYTLHLNEDIYKPVKSVLGRLAIADGKLEDFFELYSFEELFSSIQNVIFELTGQNRTEALLASIAIKKDPFAFHNSLACNVHNCIGAGQKFCSQSLIQRWILILCKDCCEAFGIDLIPGVHIPSNEQHIADDNLRSINSSLGSLQLTKDRKIRPSTYATYSMTGVSDEHRESVSRRNYQDEKKRRAEANSQPLEIFDYSKRLYEPSEPVEKPLRTPFTKSTAYSRVVKTSESKSYDFSETSFPSVDQGATAAKYKREQKPGGYAGCFK